MDLQAARGASRASPGRCRREHDHALAPVQVRRCNEVDGHRAGRGTRAAPIRRHTRGVVLGDLSPIAAEVGVVVVERRELGRRGKGAASDGEARPRHAEQRQRRAVDRLDVEPPRSQGVNEADVVANGSAMREHRSAGREEDAEHDEAERAGLHHEPRTFAGRARFPTAQGIVSSALAVRPGRHAGGASGHASRTA